MRRTNIYLKESQIKFLKKVNSMSVTEHIRRAVDYYITDLKGERHSASLSTRVGESDG